MKEAIIPIVFIIQLRNWIDSLVKINLAIPLYWTINQNQIIFRRNKKTARKSRKIFHLSDCVEITDKNMLKLSNGIGCNDSPFSQVNQQTESMTEKFFERALFPRLFQLNCGKSRVWGLGAKHPKYNNKKIPLSFGLLPLKRRKIY